MGLLTMGLLTIGLLTMGLLTMGLLTMGLLTNRAFDRIPCFTMHGNGYTENTMIFFVPVTERTVSYVSRVIRNI